MKSSTERSRERRARLKAERPEWKLAAEVQELRARIEALEVRVAAIEAPGFANKKSGPVLEDLRARIAAVPPKNVVVQGFGTSTSQVARPFGEWESA